MRQRNNADGFFVTVEGIDGAGKSTVVNALAEEFEDTVTTSEPSSEHWIGDQVYRAIRSDNGYDCPELATFYLYMADRATHIQDLIMPALVNGEMVISDRYADSTFAYQQHALEGSVEDPLGFAKSTMAEWGLEPNTTIYIDVPVDVALARAGGGDEYEKQDFLERVKANYEQLIRESTDNRWVVIDGTQSKEAVRQQAVDIIRGRKTEYETTGSVSQDPFGL